MQVHFLPWAGIQQPITIGPVTITPWTSVRPTLPANERNFLDRYFRRYRTNNNHQVQDISIASITPGPLDDVTDEQRVTIRHAIDALTFASTIPNLRTTITTGNQLGIPNSERFQLTTQFLGNLQNFVAVQAGGQLQTWPLNAIHFCTPWEVGTSHYQTDNELLRAFGVLLNGKKHKRLATRLYETIEWFRLSHTGSPETSDTSRLIMKATAFEVLLEPDDPFAKRRLLREALHKLTDTKQLKRKAIRYSTDKKTGKGKYTTVNIIAAWLDAFYQLRNTIVHQGNLDPAKLALTLGGQHLSQLAIADLVLWEAILWELANKNLIAKSARQLANSLSRQTGKARADDAFIKKVISSNERITDYHEALGWSKK
jgi:hypothetical protein